MYEANGSGLLIIALALMFMAKSARMREENNAIYVKDKPEKKRVSLGDKKQLLKDWEKFYPEYYQELQDHLKKDWFFKTTPFLETLPKEMMESPNRTAEHGIMRYYASEISESTRSRNRKIIGALSAFAVASTVAWGALAEEADLPKGPMLEPQEIHLTLMDVK